MNPLDARNGKVCNSLLLIAVCAGSALANGRAVERAGNIFVYEADGSEKQVTSSGADSEPDLANDGTKVVFVRRLAAERREIWIADAAGEAANARPLVKLPLEVNGRKFDQAFSPRFSPDGGTVFFLVPYAATTQAIVKVAIAVPVPQFITAALNFQVVPTGQYRGDLVAQIRKAKLAPGYYEWYYLLTPDGKEVGVVGQYKGDVALFLEQQE
jgi:hypothetical protein